MIGKRPENFSLFDVGNVWPLELKPKSFYHQLAVAAKNGLFKDEDFSSLYCSNNGRPSVPPSQLAITLVLQAHDGVSDERAIENTGLDLRWCAALGCHAGTALCAKSTLQLFRAQLMINDKGDEILRRSIDTAKASGLIDNAEALIVALDTKPMLGRGATQDTYNLLAQAMRQLSRALARDANVSIRAFLDENGLAALAESSIKGTAIVDWNDEAAKNAFLSELVEMARKLLAMTSGGSTHARKNAELLSLLLLQDIEEPQPHTPTPSGEQLPTPGGKYPDAKVKQGTPRDRIPSATDPEQRHGRKSASKRFNGHKSSIAVDTQSGIILSCEVLAGNAGDATNALEQIQQAERNSGLRVAQTLGDCAYGGAQTRAAFADAKRDLIAKVPAPPGGPFGKGAFHIDLDRNEVTCPAGHTSSDCDTDKHGRKTFYFDAFCAGCPLREQCAKSQYGRTVSVHPNERELQQARQFQNTREGRAKLKRRLTVENALARLSRYGIERARYFGRTKSKFQLTIACAVANFRRAWLAMLLPGNPNDDPSRVALAILSVFAFICCAFGDLGKKTRPLNRRPYRFQSIPIRHFAKNRGFRSAF